MEKLLEWVQFIAMCGFMMFVLIMFLGPFIFPVGTIITINIFLKNLKERNSYRQVIQRRK